MSVCQCCIQGPGDLNGKLEEGSASLMLDTTPSKVVSTELTVSNVAFLMFYFYFLDQTLAVVKI